MSNMTPPLRSGMTAIAAVIALSSTPLLAQATDGAAGQAAPIVIAPPAPDVTAAPAAPVAVEQSAAPATAPAPAMRTMSTPVVHTAEAPAEAAPVATRRAPVEPKVAKAATRVVTPRAAAPAKPATPVEAAPAPAPSAPITKSAAAPAPTPVAVTPAPVAVTTSAQTTQRSTLDEDAAPIAGAVGLGLIAIGGVAFAIRRRRRTDEEDELVLEPASMEAAPAIVAPPVVAKAAPVTRTAQAKALPNGFDISHFGRHTQAAYRGPTKDNPSFSLKRRLSRASFFDQREREAAAAAAVATTRTEPVAARTKAPATADDRQVTIRMAPTRRAKTSKLALAFKKK